MNQQHIPIHLPSEHLGAAVAEWVTALAEADEFLIDLDDENGTKARRMQAENIARDRFGVSGVISDDAYMTAVLEHAAELLRQ